MLLEFDSHELAASQGFDIVTDFGEVAGPDSAQAVDNILHRSDVQEPFLPKLMQVSCSIS